jgi:hypothetical protein
MKNKKKILVKGLMVALAFIMPMFLFTACGGSDVKADGEKIVRNPFTGEGGFNEDALKQRPVACVVENHPEARPQWGMTDKNSPDIFVQGEVEGGITRTLWLFADYNALPDVVGPTRSARPPFIKFSELFDSIFVHWGFSKTRGGYTGADSVFRDDKVDHIDEMSYGGKSGLFTRKSGTGRSMEHTGIINGKNMAAAIKDKGFRTDLEKKTVFTFSPIDLPVGEKECGILDVHYSSQAESMGTTT